VGLKWVVVLIMKKIYFEKLPFYGDLYIEEVYLEFENIPVLFSCYNENHKKFLCMCSEIRGIQKWTMAQIDKKVLEDMEKGKISVYNAFARTVTGDIFLISYTKEGVTNTDIRRFKDVGEYDLPTRDLFME
jgi:hypothetical protein